MMETDTITTGAGEPPPDPAALAFDKLRREIVFLRVGIEHLAEAPSKIDIPDYTDTLAAIRAENQSLGAHYKKLRDAPALAITPDQLAEQIAAAGMNARKTEQMALAKATSDNATLSRELSRYLEQARTAQEQWKWILWTAGLSFAAGLLLMGSIWSIASRSDPGVSPPVEQPQSKGTRQR
jgi:hypothetical protein